MAFRVNGKNMAVARLMPRGKNVDDRLKYIHVSPKGTTVVSPKVIARVSLPEGANIGTQLPVVLTQEMLDEIPHVPAESEELITLPEGRPAITGPDCHVPQIDKLIPEPSEQTESFTVNAETLLKVLKTACEVTDDAAKTIRLRICPDKKSLRIDAYRQPGKQEFLAVIRQIEYYGAYIPGDKPTDAPPKEEEPPVQGNMLLKATTGRKFRG